METFAVKSAEGKTVKELIVKEAVFTWYIHNRAGIKILRKDVCIQSSTH